MPFYSAFGLRICSALPLPGLRPSPPFDSEADLTISPLSEALALPTLEGQGLLVGYTDESVILRWSHFGKYVVREGRRIEYAPAPDISESAVRVPLLGVCMGVLLHQRGLLTLHASAVSDGDGAIAFVGEKGAGKSTVTAALVEDGFKLLSDDVTALSIEGAAPIVLPGIAAIKLWPDSLEAVGRDPATVPVLHENVEKRIFQPSDLVEPFGQRLRCLYVLESGEQVGSTPVPTHEAFAELVRHTYAARFLGGAAASPTHFEQCATVLRTVKVRKLVRPKDIGQLSALVDFVKAELDEESTF